MNEPGVLSSYGGGPNALDLPISIESPGRNAVHINIVPPVEEIDSLSIGRMEIQVDELVEYEIVIQWKVVRGRS
jgi:hypothetical protein